MTVLPARLLAAGYGTPCLRIMAAAVCNWYIASGFGDASPDEGSRVNTSSPSCGQGRNNLRRPCPRTFWRTEYGTPCLRTMAAARMQLAYCQRIWNTAAERLQAGLMRPAGVPPAGNLSLACSIYTKPSDSTCIDALRSAMRIYGAYFAARAFSSRHGRDSSPLLRRSEAEGGMRASSMRFGFDADMANAMP